jgi:hypothetical protein
MRKLFLIVFILLSVNAFSQYLNIEWISTSEGIYKCRIWYHPRSTGTFEEWVSVSERFYTPLEKPSNGQFECVNKMLSKYQNKIGDVYEVFVEWQSIPGNEYSWRTVIFVLQFTSNTQYKYRAFIYN